MKSHRTKGHSRPLWQVLHISGLMCYGWVGYLFACSSSASRFNEITSARVKTLLEVRP